MNYSHFVKRRHSAHEKLLLTRAHMYDIVRDVLQMPRETLLFMLPVSQCQTHLKAINQNV
jgi:hypothetical protein